MSVALDDDTTVEVSKESFDAEFEGFESDDEEAVDSNTEPFCSPMSCLP